MKDKIQSFLYLKLFFVIVFIVVFVAISLRIISEYQNSSFKYNYFSVLYISKDVKIITIDKNNNTASFLSIGNISSELKGKSPLEASIILGVPLDGIIINPKPILSLSDFTKFDNEKSLLVANDKNLKGLNHYDIYKFISSLKNISRDNTFVAKINLKDPTDVNSVSNYFKDSKVRQLPYTIEVINSTNISGLANRVANILTLYGYNVVSTTNSTQNSTSFIEDANIDKNFVGPLISLTQFKEKEGRYSQIADVAVFLGTDLESDINQ